MRVTYHPLAVGFVKMSYAIFFVMLFPIYYVVKLDFKKNLKANPFYKSKFVQLSEKYPILYEIMIVFVNFPLHSRVYKLFPAEIKGDVLQVGCGTGILNVYFSKRKRDIRFTNLDTNLHALQYGKKKKRFESYLHSGIEKTGLPDKSFDYILFARCFHHVRSTKKTFAECERLIRDDGKIIILDPVTWLKGEQESSDEAYMANSTMDGLIWRYSTNALVTHIERHLPPGLQVVEYTTDRQLITANYGFKYPTTDALVIIGRRGESV
ncbi:class I SAM-dependent methyltransferase [Paenibacillus sinopodophylli]|uniref:class I SAM-dependent methyltransferase n=1 Tax=Paenibacillus sinopodophylli TaxID=1837342 RepID=UPI0014863ADC|nr:class I SAM-dependent methyltransferase [Paenibacillus sinopodophylli]